MTAATAAAAPPSGTEGADGSGSFGGSLAVSGGLSGVGAIVDTPDDDGR
jgi:hypothetical protein